MRAGKRFVGKDMEDLKKDIADTAGTAKEIVQDAFRDGKEKAKNTAESVDEKLKAAAEKTRKSAAEHFNKEK